MITHIRSVVVLPGKMFEFLGVAKEMQATLTRIAGRPVALTMAFGGDPMTVGYLAQFEGNLGDFEAAIGKLGGDADYRALFKRMEEFVVPGSYRDQIWRHVV
jgi:hypothetical protein